VEKEAETERKRAVIGIKLFSLLDRFLISYN